MSLKIAQSQHCKTFPGLATGEKVSLVKWQRPSSSRRTEPLSLGKRPLLFAGGFPIPQEVSTLHHSRNGPTNKGRSKVLPMHRECINSRLQIEGSRQTTNKFVGNNLVWSRQNQPLEKQSVLSWLTSMSAIMPSKSSPMVAGLKYLYSFHSTPASAKIFLWLPHVGLER